MSAFSEAASENKRRRGRPRAGYSTLGIRDESGGPVETPHNGGCRTRRGQQNQQLAFIAWHWLSGNWRPEWAWFWVRRPGEIDPPFGSGDKDRDFSRFAYPTAAGDVACFAASVNMPQARVGILAELGRMSAEDAISWAAELATLPLETRSKDVERCLRNARLGRPQSTATGRLAQEVAALLDRHVARGVSLDEAEDALADVVRRVQVVRAKAPRARVEEQPAAEDQAAAEEQPRLRVEDEQPRTRIAEEEPDEELSLAEGAGVLLRAKAVSR